MFRLGIRGGMRYCLHPMFSLVVSMVYLLESSHPVKINKNMQKGIDRYQREWYDYIIK